MSRFARGGPRAEEMYRQTRRLCFFCEKGRVKSYWVSFLTTVQSGNNLSAAPSGSWANFTLISRSPTRMGTPNRALAATHHGVLSGP